MLLRRETGSDYGSHVTYWNPAAKYKSRNCDPDRIPFEKCRLRGVAFQLCF